MGQRVATAATGFAVTMMMLSCGGPSLPGGPGSQQAPAGPVAGPDPDGTQPPQAGPSAQTEFDFTVIQDRAQFTEQDLSYRGSIGPYAIYQITGPSPKLTGPHIAFNASGGYAMVCGAHGYFASQTPAGPSQLQLFGGEDGQQKLMVAQQVPQGENTCTMTSDAFGQRIGGPPTSTEQLVLVIDPAPPAGSTLLLRRVALSGENPWHNGSHIIPSVCCAGDQCMMQ